MPVGVGNSHDLSHGIVLVFYPDIAAAGMLNGLPLPSLFVGVALSIPAQGIGNLGFEHRLAVVIDDGVSRVGSGSVGQFYLRLTVVRVVSRCRLRIACCGVILCDIREVLGNGIECRDVAPEGIEYGAPTDNRDLGGCSALPNDARLLGLHSAHQAVGKGVGLDVAILRIVNGVRASPIRQVLVFDGKGLPAFYLVWSGDGHGTPHVIIGVAHLLPVQVGRLRRHAPLVVVDRARSIAVSVFYRGNKAVEHIIVDVGIEHTLSLAVLRLGEF